MCSRDYSLRRTKTALQTAIESPKSTVGTDDRSRCLAKSLIGNVNCGALDTGTDEEVIESARYALRHGMPGGGYIFSTSNCVYTGMRLERYELMLNVWMREGNYQA